MGSGESNEKRSGQLECLNNEHHLGYTTGSAGRDRRVVETASACGNMQNFSLPKWSERLTHRWGGHMARFSEDHWLAMALRTRSVQWWRWRQCRHKDKWTGVHRKHFNIIRWEDQLCKWHGDENTGWWYAVQNMFSWRSSAQSNGSFVPSFATSLGVLSRKKKARRERERERTKENARDTEKETDKARERYEDEDQDNAHQHTILSSILFTGASQEAHRARERALLSQGLHFECAMAQPDQSRDSWKVAKHFVAGGVAGVAARTAIAPIERIKIIYQIRVSAGSMSAHEGWFVLIRRVAQESGGGLRAVPAFWKGNSVAVIRVFPYLGVQLSCNEYLRNVFGSISQSVGRPMPKEVNHFLAGGVAGAMLC